MKRIEWIFGKLMCIEKDKLMHFTVSMLIFLFLFRFRTTFWAAAAAMAVGTAKEIWDCKYGSGWCWKDLAADVAGIAVGILLIQWIRWS